ncbi:hypothetical protein NEQG_02657 [Nematocida parisii ERTm3]|uniref:Uncharacterized protein n=1 Tax=Nematocida parisii (strain ERTm3) TaxID=935791 RepID=I3ED40_NEMP3|nr:hypothetical protein NEQG_02657 [Nematocida parisii ERTm3]
MAARRRKSSQRTSSSNIYRRQIKRNKKNAGIQRVHTRAAQNKREEALIYKRSKHGRQHAHSTAFTIQQGSNLKRVPEQSEQAHRVYYCSTACSQHRQE